MADRRGLDGTFWAVADTVYCIVIVWEIPPGAMLGIVQVPAYAPPLYEKVNMLVCDGVVSVSISRPTTVFVAVFVLERFLIRKVFE